METSQRDRDLKILLRAIQVIGSLALQYAVLRLAAGTRLWLWMWVYFLLYVLGVLFVSQLFLRRIPETVARRSESTDMKGWDKFVGGYGLGLHSSFYRSWLALISALAGRRAIRWNCTNLA